MTALPRQRAIVISIAAVIAIGIADWLSGRQFSFGALYILPICFAAWSVGPRAGIGTGLLGAAIAVAINGPVGPFQPPEPITTGIAAAWDTAMRLFVVIVLVMLVGGFRRLFDIERRRSQFDNLTGAYTRHAFDERINLAINLARRHNLSLVFAYLDLDGFKSINDRHGHAAGDDVLKTFSVAAAGAIRQSDTLCRIGGDEFLIMLTTDSSLQGYTVIEHLHNRLTRILAALPYDIGCSMGAVVIGNASVTNPAQYIALADALMYEVKKSGKNAYRVTEISGNQLRSMNASSTQTAPASFADLGSAAAA